MLSVIQQIPYNRSINMNSNGNGSKDSFEPYIIYILSYVSSQLYLSAFRFFRIVWHLWSFWNYWNVLQELSLKTSQDKGKDLRYLSAHSQAQTAHRNILNTPKSCSRLVSLCTIVWSIWPFLIELVTVVMISPLVLLDLLGRVATHL